MLNSHKNYVVVKEKMIQFNDKFEMLLEVHEEMLELQGVPKKQRGLET